MGPQDIDVDNIRSWKSRVVGKSGECDENALVVSYRSLWTTSHM
jgi:hypothetical protein